MTTTTDRADAATAFDPGGTGHAGHAETGWDRRKRATRTALRYAAVALVEERGLSGVTVEEIAA